MRMNSQDNFQNLTVLRASDWKDYTLLDSGNGRKLERFGDRTLIRPEAEAIWQPLLPAREWAKAQAEFVPSAEENGGHWVSPKKNILDWTLGYKYLKFKCQLSNSKQVGVFPEQSCQWDWVRAQIAAAKRPVRVLNLFGYTGAISMAAAKSGAQVTHLDASRKAIQWAKENRTLNQLSESSIRWMVDDGLKFVQREIRRDSFYEGIIMDPPKFGRGPKGEVWEFYRGFPDLLRAAINLLSADARFLLVTAYAIKASSITLDNAMREGMRGRGGKITSGEVCLVDQSGNRTLSMAIFSRWQREGIEGTQ